MHNIKRSDYKYVPTEFIQVFIKKQPLVFIMGKRNTYGFVRKRKDGMYIITGPDPDRIS